MTKLYYCVRVYPNFSAKHTLRQEDGMKGWFDYNLQQRPGNALFIDGKFAGSGLNSLEWRDAIPLIEQYLELRGIPANLSEDTIQAQTEIIGKLSGLTRQYVGYKPENEMDDDFEKWMRNALAP